ncbi:unnamed protein product [Oikopleura dioica]|uniref:Uncharacterized protein n=1 Tax=Oikopleura dioica TaxID=34765 RepID=E4Y1C9_OIKDI|nr:unnamed protein product [Oikopleura dioica]
MGFCDEIVNQEKLAEFDRFYTSYVFLEITRTIKIVNCFEKAHELNEVKKIEQRKLKNKDQSNKKLQKEISQLEMEEIELRRELKKSREERLAFENELKLIAAKKAKKAKK